MVRSIELSLRVAAPSQFRKSVLRNHREKLLYSWITIAKVLPDIGPVLDAVLLKLPIDNFVTPLHQSSINIFSEERIPFWSPNYLDDVPPCSTEDRFEFLNDLAVAANRAVESLEVTVNDEG